MSNEKNYDFISFRIKKDTFETLKETKEAFEDFCDKKQTMDEFVQMLIHSLSKAEPEFWDVFMTKQEMERMLREKMETARAKRNLLNNPEREAIAETTAKLYVERNNREEEKSLHGTMPVDDTNIEI